MAPMTPPRETTDSTDCAIPVSFSLSLSLSLSLSPQVDPELASLLVRGGTNTTTTKGGPIGSQGRDDDGENGGRAGDGEEEEEDDDEEGDGDEEETELFDYDYYARSEKSKVMRKTFRAPFVCLVDRPPRMPT